MEGFTINARDGELGSARDLYFDDETWNTRYVVVETGSWLQSRRVLISPLAVQRIDRRKRRVDVDLTCEQVAGSPPVETEIPVSRQKELQYRDYFSWPAYWIGAYYAPIGLTPLPLTSMHAATSRGESMTFCEQPGDPHLRSLRAIAGYHVVTHSGPVGRVSDFVLADWRIRDFIVETGGWLHHRDLLVSPHRVDHVSWEMSSVVLNIDSKRVFAGMEYHGLEDLVRDGADGAGMPSSVGDPVTLHLSPEEAELLRRLLAYDLGELKMEIGRTEDFGLRQSLKRDEAMIKDLSARIEPRAMVMRG